MNRELSPFLANRAISTVEGKSVALGPRRCELLSLYQKWLNDFAVMVPLGAALRPVTAELEEATYQETSQDDHQVWFTVHERATNRATVGPAFAGFAVAARRSGWPVKPTTSYSWTIWPANSKAQPSVRSSRRYQIPKAALVGICRSERSWGAKNLPMLREILRRLSK